MRWVWAVFIATPVWAFCPEALIGASEALNAPPPLSLLQYQPENVAVADVAFTEPSLMVSLDGSVKGLDEVRRWYGGPPIAKYGRPYVHEGEWCVDFHSLSTHSSGSRLLWRMPYLDFIEGTRSDFIPVR